MNRKIYDAAFEVLHTQESMCQNLEKIGLRFEYGDGVVGQALLDLLNHSETIIKESLGLHLEIKDAKCTIGGVDYPVYSYVLCTDDNDSEWSITEDDFCEFFHHARNDIRLQDLMWKAITEKDAEAKDMYNNLGYGRIGCVEK